MTGKDYVSYILDHFKAGNRWIELPSREPKALRKSIGSYVWRYKLGWRFQILDEKTLVVRIHKPYVKPAAPKKSDKPDEQKQLPGLDLIGRPEAGPRCKCGRTLYHYEHGKCLKCSRRDIINAREGKV